MNGMAISHSNEGLKEAEKETRDGQYVVQALYVNKFPFLKDGM
jgi:hypothetical protein